jgi:arachidonate 15-lipoxygenase
MLEISIIQQIVQDFARECSEPLRGARVKGMPAQIERRAMLGNILTSIIFVCGPLHSTINFAQYECMAFIPNMPFGIYRPSSFLQTRRPLSLNASSCW